MRVTPCHLFGSETSPLLGTGNTWPSCHSVSSVSPRQYALKKVCSISRFWFERALKASGGTSFSPGDFPFASFLTANLTSSVLIDSFIPSTVSRVGILSRAYHVMGRSRVYMSSKCGARMEAFLASVVAKVPLGNIICMTTGFTWWLSLPHINNRTDLHACLGVNFMSCTFWDRCADHVAFAREMVSVTISWAVVSSVVITVAVCDVSVRRECRSWSRCVMAGRSSSLEW